MLDTHQRGVGQAVRVKAEIHPGQVRGEGLARNQLLIDVHPCLVQPVVPVQHRHHRLEGALQRHGAELTAHELPVFLPLTGSTDQRDVQWHLLVKNRGAAQLLLDDEVHVPQAAAGMHGHALHHEHRKARREHLVREERVQVVTRAGLQRIAEAGRVQRGIGMRRLRIVHPLAEERIAEVAAQVVQHRRALVVSGDPVDVRVRHGRKRLVATVLVVRLP